MLSGKSARLRLPAEFGRLFEQGRIGQDIRISPDGEWTLGSRPGEWLLSSQQFGGLRSVSKSSSEATAEWAQDGKAWIEWWFDEKRNGAHLVLHTLPPPGEATSPPRDERALFAAGAYDVIGCPSSETALVALETRTNLQATLRVATVQLNMKSGTTRQTLTQFGESLIVDVTPSSNGQRIYWLVVAPSPGEDGITPTQTDLKAWLESPATIQVWRTDQNGESKQMVFEELRKELKVHDATSLSVKFPQQLRIAPNEELGAFMLQRNLLVFKVGHPEQRRIPN